MTGLPTTLGGASEVFKMRRLAALVPSILLALAFLAAQAPAAHAASGWNAETLDAGDSTGAYSSTVYYPTYLQHHVFNQGIETGQSVLRHGWFQPGFSSWAFETLDATDSVGAAASTMVWNTQHHVFNQGIESGQSVLRHGWFEPIVGAWQFETLDAGISDGTDTATIAYSGQQHVFSHGLESGQDVLRHGWFDIGVGHWQFETLDAASSAGTTITTVTYGSQLQIFDQRDWSTPCCGVRHGWFDSNVGYWQFETLFSTWPTWGQVHARNSAVTKGSEVHYFFSSIISVPRGGVHVLAHGWWDGRSWNVEVFVGAPPNPCDSPYHPSATVYHGHLELFCDSAFNFYPPGGGGSFIGVYSLGHLFYDGAWHGEHLDPDYPGAGESTGAFSASTDYPVYDQLHAFNVGASSTLRHVWYNN